MVKKINTQKGRRKKQQLMMYRVYVVLGDGQVLFCFLDFCRLNDETIVHQKECAADV